MYNQAPRVLLEGLDGSGKSTAALEAAATLAESYPANSIKVVDSTGVHLFKNGGLSTSRFTHLEELEPHQESSRFSKILRLGAFSTARRMLDSWMTGGADMIISVRDPFRIDPAAYLAIFAPRLAEKYSREDRLRFFNRFTTAGHPEQILHLTAGVEAIHNNLANTNPHDPAETYESITIMAEELPLILSSYRRLYGIDWKEVEALTKTTSDEIASQVEPRLYGIAKRDAFAGGATTIAL